MIPTIIFIDPFSLECDMLLERLIVKCDSHRYEKQRMPDDKV